MNSNIKDTVINLLFVLLFIGCSSIGCSSTNTNNFNDKKLLYQFEIYSKNENEIKDYLDSNHNNLNPIEGMWSVSYENHLPNGEIINQDNVCKVAIINSTETSNEKYYEILFGSIADTFVSGSIVGFFNSSAYDNVYTSTQIFSTGERFNANFFIDDFGMLKCTHDFFSNGQKITSIWKYMKLYPKNKNKFTKKTLDSNSLELKGTGSGFLISSTGLIVTNHHVVVDGARIEIVFPGKGLTKKAKVKMKDIQNDIAILEIENFTFSDISFKEIPFSFAENSSVKVGQDVFTLGYPLGDIMGTTPRLANGSISSVYGLNDDPRLFQISNPIQPGNSGGALFNYKGELVGICVSGLNAKYFYENAGIIPQNMNFAIKASYLKNLIGMMAEGDAVLNRTNAMKLTSLEEQVEQLNPFIVQIRVY